MIKLITIIGLVLQFISFWLAAPEILGPDWIVKTEEFFRKLIRKIPTVLLTIIGTIFGIIFYQSIQFNTIFILVILAAIIGMILLFHKRLENFLDQKISTPLIQKLILSTDFRFTLLKLAAVFFTIGFVIQIILVIIS